MQAPTRPECNCKGKQHSGACNKKWARIRQEAEYEARMQLLRVQGKLTDMPNQKVAWVPRAHQKLLKEARKKGIRWQAHVWHRRAGKSAAALDLLVDEALKRPGNYWYLTPKASQTRVAIWDSRRADGRKEIDVHIPAELRERTNENQMTIELINGSAIQFLGSDNFDRLVGANVHGIIFDEFALGKPEAWDYLYPILVADSASWAVFISTYRGRNHWYRMVERVKELDDWVTSSLTIDDTKGDDGKPIVTQEDLERIRAQGRPEEYIRQEFYNDAMAAFDGAYYAFAMRAMQDEGRIGHYVYDPAKPVVASVDLGYSDEMVFTFWQQIGNEEHCIGSKSFRFTNLTDALDDIKLTFPWGKKPMVAVIPHDGRWAAEVFEERGYEPVLLPRTQSVTWEIDKVRAFLGHVFIDNAPRPWTDNEENNARLVNALLGYRTARSNSDADVYQKSPTHTWESHWADSTRYYAVYREQNPSHEMAWGPAPNYSVQDRINRMTA